LREKKTPGKKKAEKPSQKKEKRKRRDFWASFRKRRKSQKESKIRMSIPGNKKR